jgi:mRNA interferase RelE/StbE
MPTFTVEIVRSAAKELKALPKWAKQAVAKALAGLEENPFPSGFKKLQGMKSIFRLRCGNYRVVYGVNTDDGLVEVFRIRHRKDAYD